MRDILDQFRQELTEIRTFRETLEDLTSRVARIEQKLGLTANGMDIEGPSLQDIVENISDHVRYLEEKVDPDNGTEETFVDDNIVVQNWAQNHPEVPNHFDPITCRECGHCFKTVKEYNDHNCVDLRCREAECKFEAQSKAELDLHFQSYHQNVQCKYCGKTGKGMANLRDHFKKDHPEHYNRNTSGRISGSSGNAGAQL